MFEVLGAVEELAGRFALLFATETVVVLFTPVRIARFASVRTMLSFEFPSCVDRLLVFIPSDPWSSASFDSLVTLCPFPSSMSRGLVGVFGGPSGHSSKSEHSGLGERDLGEVGA